MNGRLTGFLVLFVLVLASCAGEDPTKAASRPELVAALPELPEVQSSRSAAANPVPSSTLPPAPTSTQVPTNTAVPTTTPTPTDTPTPTMAPTPLPQNAYLGHLNHQAQIENNCGPASVAILLGFYDEWISQFQVNEAGLHKFPSPCQIVRYIQEEYGEEGEKLLEIDGREQPLQARVFRLPFSSDRDRLRPMKHLAATGIPMIVYQRLQADSDVAHYRVIHGYDDEAGVLIADDPYLGSSYFIAYDSMEDYLFELNVSHIFIPIYPLERDEEVQAAMQYLGAARVYIACSN